MTQFTAANPRTLMTNSGNIVPQLASYIEDAPIVYEYQISLIATTWQNPIIKVTHSRNDEEGYIVSHVKEYVVGPCLIYQLTDQPKSVINEISRMVEHAQAEGWINE